MVATAVVCNFVAAEAKTNHSGQGCCLQLFFLNVFFFLAIIRHRQCFRSRICLLVGEPSGNKIGEPFILSVLLFISFLIF